MAIGCGGAKAVQRGKGAVANTGMSGAGGGTACEMTARGIAGMSWVSSGVASTTWTRFVFLSSRESLTRTSDSPEFNCAVV